MSKVIEKLTPRQKTVFRAFSKAGLNASFGLTHVNIMRDDGMHCEFYHDGELNYVTATYTLNNVTQSLDFMLPSELNEFVEAVKQILEVDNDDCDGGVF